MFPLIASIFLTEQKNLKKKKKLKTELKNLSHSSHAFALSKGTIFAPKY